MNSGPFVALLIVLLFSQPTMAKSFKSKMKEQVNDVAKSAMTTAPKDNETCFAPDQPCAFKLIKFIESAKKSIDVAIFDITDKRVAQAIIDQTGKGIRIRMVTNRRTRDSTGAYQMLKDAHVLVRVGKQKGIMHNKFTLIDRHRLETGSYNYSYGAANSNQENQLYLSTPSVVEAYRDRFEKMWVAGKTR
jgi:cardiolipin hydrolase